MQDTQTTNHETVTPFEQALLDRLDTIIALLTPVYEEEDEDPEIISEL